jgi:hypothetical protein
MLDFTKTTKKFLNIKLIDGNTILVRMPTKKVFDALIHLQGNLSTLKLEDAKQIEFVYDLMAQILSNNLENKKIESDYIAEILDIEDIQTLFMSYVNFVTCFTNDPNLKSPQSQERMEGTSATDVQQNGNG